MGSDTPPIVLWAGKLTAGALVSTTHVRPSVPTVLPPLMTCTLKVCLPLASPVYCLGEAHEPKAAPSRLHLKVGLGLGEEKEKRPRRCSRYPQDPRR